MTKSLQYQNCCSAAPAPPLQHPAAFVRRIRGALAIRYCSAQHRPHSMTFSSRQRAVPLAIQLAATHKAARFDGIYLLSAGGAAAVSMQRAQTGCN